MTYRHIFFDLDGTLVDSAEGILNSARHALDSCGIHEAVRRDVRPKIGLPLEEMLAFAAPGADKATVARLVREYRNFYRETGMFQARVYDGLQELLSALAERGRDLHIVTLKYRPFAEKVAEAHGLRGFFASVSGPGETPQTKASLMAELLGARGFSPRECLMVGDRAEDVLAARENGVDAAGVTYGFGSRAELEEAQAKFVVDTPGELLSAAGQMQNT